MKILGWIAVIIVALLLVSFLMWGIFFRKKYTLLELFRKLLEFALLPFKLILKLFGIGKNTTTPSPSSPEPTPAPTIPEPSVPVVQHTEVIKHEIETCPPCNVECPPAPAAKDCKPLEMEIGYLKNMVKFVGSMAMRENAINAQYRELYPGFSVMSPQVRKLSYEYNFLKNQLREDENQWTYFKNYFTKLSGIPSTSSAVHYDLTL